ncbi:MAG: hypothetical protein C0611_06465 [Desulfobacteraceae bacterium]|nr:MAG: hypothetical protein C0611_06465 [Desulfobacteraceae bacterium]
MVHGKRFTVHCSRFGVYDLTIGDNRILIDTEIILSISPSFLTILISGNEHIGRLDIFDKLPQTCYK